jgi:DNA topoisomerase-1
VCVRPEKNAKLQATAVDKKGKTHYYYHGKFLETQKKKRFERVKGVNMKKILRGTAQTLDTEQKGSDSWKAAAALRLIALTGIRPGSEKYLAENGSVGAMTLRPNHYHPLKGGGSLIFNGKSKVSHNIRIRDPRLNQALSWLAKHTTDRLFGNRKETVALLRKMHNDDVKLKDVRTSLANDLYQAYLSKLHRQYPQETEKRIRRNALKQTARQMGHTPSVCKKYYLIN